MKTLVVVSHPTLETSQTQAFLQASAAGLPNVTWHPVTSVVTEEAALLRAADRIVLQFPLYWYQAPASLKQWLDTVWTDELTPALAGKSLGLVVSFGQPEAAYQAGGREGISLSTLLSPYAALARKVRLHLLPTLTVPQFAYQTEGWRQRLLVRYQQYLQLADPQRFAAQAEWWQARLAAYPEAALLAETLAVRQEQWQSLQDELHEMKGGHRDGND
ncbi:NAD(P)H-dependent oxidoreductase [Lacticaseibacillus absianus]|uniref:NAD(P)H-dependent oxidoreductase n=1 Tax=Lacticaseibacillus absianus TaxID=2729623 RepID=UPI0015C9EB9B|nr:NAD(P)H-dependent oxidoreductase [Lacticaseibacillus absianus]